MKTIVDREKSEVAIFAQQNAVVLTFQQVKDLLEQITKEKQDEHR